MLNPRLLDLLRAAGVAGPIEWDQMLIVQNYAPLPPPPALAGTGSFHRGLNLIVLDGRTPTHFCKCRPIGESGVLRETHARNTLAEAATSLRVLPATMASSDSITVQVSRFLSGVQYGGVLEKQPTPDFIDGLDAVLSGLGPLADHALRAGGELAPKPGPRHLLDDATPFLEYLTPVIGIESSERAELSGLIADAGMVPTRPQHVDLWWRNVIVADGHHWAVDFEDYGEVCVPLYDDLTLLVSALSLRHPHIAGVESLCADSPDGAACRSLLQRRAISEGIEASQLDALLLYYVLRRGAFVHERAGADHATPHLDAARYVRARITAGERDLLRATS